MVDTDYVADYLKGYQAATNILTQLLSEGIGISIITFAEVYEGIYYGQNRPQHEAGFRTVLATTPVLSITRLVARQFALIRGDLRAKGLLIPDPDLYIAATAIHHHLMLVTRMFLILHESHLLALMMILKIWANRYEKLLLNMWVTC